MTMFFAVILTTQRKKNAQSSKDSLVYFITEIFFSWLHVYHGILSVIIQKNFLD